MSCEETRQKLSMAADRELSDDELRLVQRHVARCPACEAQLKEHGALNMLLKNNFSFEPPEGYIDDLWPAVAERAEQGAGAAQGAGGGGDDELVFKSSPAMDFLNIPERRPPPRVERVESSEVTAAPEPQGSPWRWPVALIVSTAIVVVGYLAYKKISPPPAQVAAVTAQGTEPEPAAPSEPLTAPVVDAGMQVAALAAGDGGAASTDEPGGTEDTASAGGTSASAARHHRRSRRHRRKHKTRAGDKPEPVAAPPAPAPAAKKGPAPPAKKGGTALDNLLDDAIGGKQPADAPKKKAEAAAPKSDLPDQLNMNQIREAMNKVKGRVAACYDQFQVEGMANVGFTIKGSGKIGGVSIRGKFRGTDTGDCVVKAVKRARFPKFSGKPMTIKNYPFLLQ